MKKIRNVIKSPKILFVKILNGMHFLPDEIYLKIRYFLEFGKKLDLKNPKTFNEKLNWLKINDRKPEYNKLVDKYLVREYIADTIGEEYLIPLLGVWDSFDEIDFDSLPEQFVLKCTHDSGSVVICKDKKAFDYAAAKKKIERKLKKNMYWWAREWVYKDLMPRIIAEQYMEDSFTAELRDYKFFAFNGEAKMIFVATDRQNANEETKFDFFDMEYNHLDFTHGHPNAKVLPEKPKDVDKMRELTEVLSKGLPHVRVDFYYVEEKIYFGEITFYHNAGLVPFAPEEWDLKLGELFALPKNHGGGCL